MNDSWTGEARDAAAVRVEVAKDADQVLGPAVAEDQHEDHQRHLHQSATQVRCFFAVWLEPMIFYPV